MATHIVIPARFASTRLPGKPLADIAGVPMIVRVAHQALKAQVDDVVVAVDDNRVLETVSAAGLNAVMTSQAHPSGSDRVMEVASLGAWPDDDIVINVQGDEPLFPPVVVEELAQGLLTSEGVGVGTLCEPLGSPEDFYDPNIVKVVRDRAGLALLFSRAPIPYPRDADITVTQLKQAEFRRHIGIYAFRVSALKKFVALGESTLERIERLEQLRWLQAGEPLLVVDASEPVPGGVDTAVDLERIQAVFAKNA